MQGNYYYTGASSAAAKNKQRQTYPGDKTCKMND